MIEHLVCPECSSSRLYEGQEIYGRQSVDDIQRASDGHTDGQWGTTEMVYESYEIVGGGCLDCRWEASSDRWVDELAIKETEVAV